MVHHIQGNIRFLAVLESSVLVGIDPGAGTGGGFFAADGPKVVRVWHRTLRSAHQGTNYACIMCYNFKFFRRDGIQAIS